VLAQATSAFSTGTRRTNLELGFEEAQTDMRLVQIHENVGGLGALLLNVLQADAFTLGSHIFTTQESIYPVTYRHERGHVTQYDILGPLLLPLYFTNHLSAQSGPWISRDPYYVPAANMFEQWTQRLGGLPPIPLYPY
jgi:hypothetical protein